MSREIAIPDRTKFIGGSDAATILGKSPWSTPYELWREKIGDPVRKRFTSAMRWGTLLEPVVLQHFADIHPGSRLRKFKEPFVSAAHPFIQCQPDSIAELPDEGPAVHLRHHHVRDEQIGRANQRALERVLAVDGGLHAVAALLEHGRHHAQDPCVVVGD